MIPVEKTTIQIDKDIKKELDKEKIIKQEPYNSVIERIIEKKRIYNMISIKDVKDFLISLLSYCDIHIIPGNHDGNIKKISPSNIIIHSSDGFIFKDIGLIHGHRWASSELMLCKYLIIGHTHPTIMFEDRLGYKKFESCWLKGEISRKSLVRRYPNSKNIKFINIPAFNPLCGGIPLNIDGFIGLGCVYGDVIGPLK